VDTEQHIRVRVGCEFIYDVSARSPAAIQVVPRPGEATRLLEDSWEMTPEARVDVVPDLYGNQIRRTVLGQGSARFRYDGLVEVPSAPDPVGESAVQHPVQELDG
jgi:hypothetical protein